MHSWPPFRCMLDAKLPTAIAVLIAVKFLVSVGELLASTIQAEQADVDLAVTSARKAFQTWGCSSGHYRARILYRFLPSLNTINIFFHASDIL